ncbi:uncharacterized protein N7500_009517 [Penicillium coprophilum]|uniref:uncharacterized protein n=1 Tax=Penicillium coprophilum TaxID=36646 RepID=UPI00238A21B3|nr:uncharacterized protein N7500_009517 [Penicillium coprophilum]KAJ5154078.1 hypothetical protein N7500_009517 [Penicillium coprophilum]
MVELSLKTLLTRRKALELEGPLVSGEVNPKGHSPYTLSENLALKSDKDRAESYTLVVSKYIIKYILMYHTPISKILLLSKKGGRSANRWLLLRYFFVKDTVT